MLGLEARPTHPAYLLQFSYSCSPKLGPLREGTLGLHTCLFTYISFLVLRVRIPRLPLLGDLQTPYRGSKKPGTPSGTTLSISMVSVSHTFFIYFLILYLYWNDIRHISGFLYHSSRVNIHIVYIRFVIV